MTKYLKVRKVYFLFLILIVAFAKTSFGVNDGENEIAPIVSSDLNDNNPYRTFNPQNLELTADDKSWLDALGNYQFRYVEYSDIDPNISSYGTIESGYGKRYFFNISLKEVLNQAQENYNYVTTGCLIFTQIAHRLKASQNEESFELGGLMGDAEPTTNRISFNGSRYTEIDEELQKLRMINKGIWVIPTSEGHYLGLSNHGPAIMTKDGFVRDLVEGMKAEKFKNLQSSEEKRKKMGRAISQFLQHEAILNKSSSWIVKRGRAGDLIEQDYEQNTPTLGGSSKAAENTREVSHNTYSADSYSMQCSLIQR